MRRTQLYLDNHLWSALSVRARREKTTVSALVRQAIRERYLGDHEQRRAAMHQFVGVRKGACSDMDATDELRLLRRGSRPDTLVASNRPR